MPKPPHYRPIITEDEAVMALPRIIPRTKPTPIPTPSIFDEPTYCLKVNKEWAGHFLGVILIGLNQPDTWKADETHDVAWAREQIVEWVAKFLTENDCMPCCDDLVEQLTTLIEINNTMLTNITTIVTNLTTVINNQVIQIDNSETVIELTETEVVNQYISNYQQWVFNNQETRILNQMLYDGTKESIAPNLGEDFSSTDATENALCLALTRFIEQEVYSNVSRAQLAVGLGAVAATTLIALGIVTGGATIAAGFAVGSTVVALNTYMDMLNDPAAQREVLCCLFDSMKGQPITEENFQNMGLDCEFDPLTPAGILHGGMTHAAMYYPENYLAFLRLLSESQGSGNRADCDCCGDIAEYEIVAINDCVITRINDFQWRIEQTNYTTDFDDLLCPGGRKTFVVEFKESEGRCIDIISGGLTNGWEQVDCAGEPQSGPGGGGGQGVYFKWLKQTCPPDSSTVDIIITIACPTDLEFVP